MKPGQKLTVSIEKLVFEGYGLAKKDGFTILVAGALPGDIVDIQITQKKRGYAKGKILTFNTPAAIREKSLCTHFPTCGGCQFIDVPYVKQTDLKSDILKDCMAQFFPNAIPKIQPVVASKANQFYRNKMEFSFANDGDKVILGLKKRGSFSEVVPTPRCQLQDPLTEAILDHTATFFKGQTTWDYFKHEGFLRHLIVRHSKSTNTFMLILVASENKADLFHPFAESIMTAIPQVQSVYVSIQSNTGDTAFSTETALIKGKETLTESLGTLKFDISPLSFFQTNTHQAAVLYDTIKANTPLFKEATVFDLYCGTGTIGLYLADKVKTVIGVEENASAVENAKQNAKRNGIKNAQFFTERVKNFLKFTEIKPDIIVVDPPRSGMVPKALNRVIAMNAPFITYVSCNPTTLARDLTLLDQHGYHLETLIPVDMFPNTYHIESVAVLKKK